eukprot:1222135-Prymnesium_polylepis.1
MIRAAGRTGPSGSSWSPAGTYGSVARAICSRLASCGIRLAVRSILTHRPRTARSAVLRAGPQTCWASLRPRPPSTLPTRRQSSPQRRRVAKC